MTTTIPILEGWRQLQHGLPPEGIAVDTLIADHSGTRNEQALVRKGNLWFHTDMSMYVYYTPTHWRYQSF